ncbi:MAG: hypothetical protein IJK40_09070 [Clostridia bacterium]|nr:hypothetical protein [Clostridia bacterium]
MKEKKMTVLLLTAVFLLAALFPAGVGLVQPAANAAGKSCQVGDILNFGSFPQGEVRSYETFQKLEALEKDWKSFGCCSGSGSDTDGEMQPGGWMRYADLTLDGERYRAVTFDFYRPYLTGMLLTSSSAYAFQYRNGYRVNQVFYFLFEPLKWRVLDPAAGLVLCENAVDSGAFRDVVSFANGDFRQGEGSASLANAYDTCSVRRWLTEDFYDTAFNAAEQAQILTSGGNEAARPVGGRETRGLRFAGAWIWKSSKQGAQHFWPAT